MARHGIDYVPGCADLGDFDATSTTIALAPAAAADLLPPGALERTFERYWEFFADAPRRRTLGGVHALRDAQHRRLRAPGLARARPASCSSSSWAISRPAGWRQWAEVVRHDARTARFLGDMPHTWVGSDYIRSVLDMFAYANARPAEPAPGPGRGHPGGLARRPRRSRSPGCPRPTARSTTACSVRAPKCVLEIGGTCAVPPGGFVLRPPAAGAGALVNGRPAATGADGEVHLEAVPAVVVWPAAG